MDLFKSPLAIKIRVLRQSLLRPPLQVPQRPKLSPQSNGSGLLSSRHDVIFRRVRRIVSRHIVTTTLAPGATATQLIAPVAERLAGHDTPRIDAHPWTRAGWRQLCGGRLPLLIKLMDASDRLSVQVHPDDGMAMELGVGPRGKTECWLVLKDGGELFLGTRPGVDRAAFEAACSAGHVAEILNRFETKHGDFFFVPARTVHALGKGCLVYEIQQTCDVTFRVPCRFRSTSGCRTCRCCRWLLCWARPPASFTRASR